MSNRTAFLVLFALLACARVSSSEVSTAVQDRPAPKAEPKEKPKRGADAPASEPAPDTITRRLPDSVVMTADLYKRPKSAPDDPVLICMHMTGSSRGEYRFLAAKLMDLGFNVLAVDLRCGGAGDHADRRTGKRSGTPNETWASATKIMGHEPNYAEAYPDVGSAVAWAKELFPKAKIGLVGSSYSATLALVYAAENPKKVDAVLALSPGDYVTEWSPVKERIKGITVPTYITCGNTKADTDHAKPIGEAIVERSKLITFWPEDEGFVGHHGTMTFRVPEADSLAKQWEMFTKGLEPLRKTDKDSKPEKDKKRP